MLTHTHTRLCVACVSSILSAPSLQTALVLGLFHHASDISNVQCLLEVILIVPPVLYWCEQQITK